MPSNADENIYDLMGRHIQLTETNLEGVHAINPPPPGFDPRNADRATLLRHGLLPRPDPNKLPQAAAIWDRLAGQQYEYIIPILTPRLEKKDKPPPQGRPEVLKLAVGSADNYSGNWSGGLIFNANTATDPFQSVYGEWTVPSVVPPSSGDGDWWSLAWIGVDGYNSNDVMQVGTGQHVKRSGGKVTLEYFAWVEWYTYSWQTVSLTVNPGDSISANIANMGVQNGVLQASGRITNVTTGQTTAVAVSAPPGTIFQGNVAEWIMERPSFNNVLATLPRFGAVAFGNVLACTKSGKVYTASQGTAVDMTSNGQSSGTLYAQGKSETDWESWWVASS
jgi:hypothetical protein